MDELLRDFVVETSESIEVVDAQLVRFEQEPNNREIVAQIFRLVHTIKGTCGFLGLPRLEALAHAAESAMDRFRDGAVVTRDAVTLILRTIDRIKAIVAELDRTAAEPPGDDADLIRALDALQADGVGPTAESSEGFTVGTLVYQVLERPLKPGEASLDELERAFRETQVAEPEFPQDVLAKAGLSEPAAPNPFSSAQDAGARKTVRVHVETLDQLMNMVSELVLTRNQLMDIARREASAALTTPLQRLSQVTAALQESVMKTRMQPIGSAWTMLPRLVRDLCADLGKEIEIETRGAETEIDRQVLDLIRDPMLHMVRNAADHGIEPAAERLRCGKPAKGRLTLSASQEAGFILVSISDDGRGLDIERIRRKAVERGLAAEADIAAMTPKQIARFIFHPGFSTASSVSSVSGRGVGMDVVKTNVEQIGGAVDVESADGIGTTIQLRIPLTLAIAAALIVGVRGQRFALPQTNIIELVRPSRGSDARIEQLNGAAVLRLRERLVPLVHLGDSLNVAPGREAATEGGFVVICEADRRRFGVVVDEVVQTEEIVVKPLSCALKGLACFSGATILGDGSVIMILDVAGLVRELRIAKDADNDNIARGPATEGHAAERTPMLIFRAGAGAPFAVPLLTVTRLEEIDVATIENSGGQAVVQYRGGLMRLVSPAGDCVIRDGGRQPVIVFARRSRPVGILADEIVDIVDEVLDIKLHAARPGVLGAAVLRGRTTDVIDIAYFAPELGGGEGARLRGSSRVLLAETSDFLRAMLAPVLQSAGFHVQTAASAAEAESKLAWGGYQIVVANIEEEGMLGLASLGGAATRFVGTANRPSAALLDAAAASGFHDVVGVFDRVGLIRSVKIDERSMESAA